MHYALFTSPNIIHIYNPPLPHLHSHPSKHPNNQKPHRPHKLKKRQSSHRPQHHSHIDITRRIIVQIHRIGIRLRGPETGQTARVKHHGREREIADEPEDDDAGAETFVVILLDLFCSAFALLRWGFNHDFAHFGFVLSVKVAVVGGDVDVDFAAWFGGYGAEFFGLVVAFGSPCDVVGVAEGVDVEDVDVGWGEEEVLEEGGEHVPGVEEEEGDDEPEEVG